MIPAALPALDKALAQEDGPGCQAAHGAGASGGAAVRPGCQPGGPAGGGRDAARPRRPGSPQPAGSASRVRPVRSPKPPPRRVVSIDRVLQMWSLAESVYYGISLGSVLLLAAAGLAITFGVMGVINMAHGEMVMIGAYVTFVVQQLDARLSAVALSASAC